MSVRHGVESKIEKRKSNMGLRKERKWWNGSKILPSRREDRFFGRNKILKLK